MSPLFFNLCQNGIWRHKIVVSKRCISSQKPQRNNDNNVTQREYSIVPRQNFIVKPLLKDQICFAKFVFLNVNLSKTPNLHGQNTFDT